MGMLRSTRMIHSVASSLIRSCPIAAPLSKPYPPLRTQQPVIRSPFPLGSYVGFCQRYGFGSGITQENQKEGCADGGTSGGCSFCGQGGDDYYKKILSDLQAETTKLLGKIRAENCSGRGGNDNYYKKKTDLQASHRETTRPWAAYIFWGCYSVVVGSYVSLLLVILIEA